MKIKTDFMTNSSGSNTVEIIIDNPLLLKIINKYQKMGLIKEDNGYFSFGSASWHSHLKPEEHTSNPAMSIWIEDEYQAGYDIPKSLDDVLDVVLMIMDFEWINWQFDKEIYKKLIEELIRRKTEVNRSFLKVSWYNKMEYDGPEIYEHFNYDPINGESYSCDSEYY